MLATQNRFYFQKILFKYAIPFYVTLIFLRFSFDSQILSYFLNFIFLSYGATISLFVFSNRFSNRVIFVFFSTVIFFIFLASIFGNNSSYKAIPFFIAGFGFSLAAIISPISIKSIKLIFWSFSILFSFFVVLDVEPSQIFHVSRNFVSVFFLLLISIYFISCWQNNRSPSIYPVLVGLFFAIWGIGRSGIAVFLLLTILTFFLLKFRRKIFILPVSVVFSVVLFFSLKALMENIDDFALISLSIDRFQRMGFESLRHEINKEYFWAAFSNLNNLFWGVELSSLNSVDELGGNPHNSLIALHVNFGLLGFLFILFCIFFVLVKMVLDKSWPLLIVIVSCLARSFFDIASFYGPLDLVIIFPISYYFSKMYICQNNRGEKIPKRAFN